MSRSRRLPTRRQWTLLSSCSQSLSHWEVIESRGLLAADLCLTRGISKLHKWGFGSTCHLEQQSEWSPQSISHCARRCMWPLTGNPSHAACSSCRTAEKWSISGHAGLWFWHYWPMTMQNSGQAVTFNKNGLKSNLKMTTHALHRRPLPDGGTHLKLSKCQPAGRLCILLAWITWSKIEKCVWSQ